MTIITITKTQKKLIEKIAEYYNTKPDKIEIDEKDCVWCCGRKKKLQVDKYNNLYILAFVK